MKNRPKARYRHMDAVKATEIRRRYFAREAKQAELAAEFGVKQHTVSQIISGLRWSRA